MTTPFVYVHRVRVDEVDAAGIVYFAHFFSWCHEAMAALLAPLEGGFAALLTRRRLGLPAVHVEADFASPLRFGDAALVAVVVERVKTSSCALKFDIAHASSGDHVATIRHVVALTDLIAMRARPLPEDVRALFEAQLTPP